jgi:hypothetical protein
MGHRWRAEKEVGDCCAGDKEVVKDDVNKELGEKIPVRDPCPSPPPHPRTTPTTAMVGVIRYPYPTPWPPPFSSEARVSFDSDNDNEWEIKSPRMLMMW